MKTNKSDVAKYNQEKILIEIVKFPLQGLILSNMSDTEARETLRTKFNYTEQELQNLRK
jgi:hypothetical protein